MCFVNEFGELIVSIHVSLLTESQFVSQVFEYILYTYYSWKIQVIVILILAL